ncbi:MAG TPA: hypothetical protein VHB73_03710 [Alphaproteobacteria bacterium]|nr:hypothetical protein [Alphaproteobacteria bacterium]
MIYLYTADKLPVTGYDIFSYLPSLLYAGVFISAYKVLDEVAVNLEHPYNLLHYGRFSMSPESMVDGTVEGLFYLLHTPFAFTPASLLIGNFILCIVVGWLHLFLLWRSGLFAGRMHGLMPLSLIASSFYLVSLMANGFGNSLLSLVFLAALIANYKNRPVLSLACGGLLPLIRPEGMVWACVNAAVVLLFLKKRRTHLKSLKFYLALFSPLAASILYFSLYRIFYGHWIPTPILFKSLAFEQQDLSLSHAVLGLAGIWNNHALILPALLLLLVIAALPVFFRRMTRSRAGGLASYLAGLRHKIARWVLEDHLHQIKIIWAYLAGASVVPGYALFTYFYYNNPIDRDRYYLVFFLCLTLVLAKVFAVLLNKSVFSSALAFYFGGKAARYALLLRQGIWGGLLVLLGFHILPAEGISAWLHNRTHMAQAGAMTEKIVPAGWRIASTEINTFGLMINRPVIDLWGYSNRSIASAHVCTPFNFKTNPEAFQEANIDIYFPYWFTEYPAKYRFDNVEDGLAHSAYSHATPVFMRLNHLTEIMKTYDVVVLRYPTAQFAYLVRAARTPQFLKSLESTGLRRSKQRKIDFNRLKMDEPKLHAC